MTRRQMGAGAVFTILVVIGIMAGLQRRSAPPARALKPIEAGASTTQANSPIAHATPAAAGKSSPIGGLWMRPPAMVAAKNSRRAAFAVTLRPLGASEQLITRLADGDIVAVVTELKQLAQKGDGSASNILAYMAHFTCGSAAINGEGSTYQAAQLLDAHALPAAEADWVGAAMQERIAYNKHLSSVCQQSIDKDEADRWIAANAIQGNAASRYLLALFGSDTTLRNQQMLRAAAGGYPWAQVWLASQAIMGNPITSEGIQSPGNAADLLRAAAADLPQAESRLALCEFTGCPDIASDIPSAVTHARDAAQIGSFDAIMRIGPHLQASQIDPDEMAAWNLVYASLEQQGCASQALNAAMMKSASHTLNSPTTTANAKSLADKYWLDYGTQMLSNLGCAT
jgi:hypothetical protein